MESDVSYYVQKYLSISFFGSICNSPVLVNFSMKLPSLFYSNLIVDEIHMAK